MISPDWLEHLDEEDAMCKEGFYIGLPPNTEELCEDEEKGITWCWQLLNPNLLELIACGPPPDLNEIGFMEALTSFPCTRFYIARTTDGITRIAIVMDKFVFTVFSNMRHILKLPMTKKYIEVWLRSYHPLLSLVLNGEKNISAHNIALVWSRPSWAQRNHWVLTSPLKKSNDDFNKSRAIKITKEPNFRNIRNAHRNLLLEDAKYLTVKGQITGAGRVALEGLTAMIDKFTEEHSEDTLDSLLNEFNSQTTNKRQSLKTSFRKPNLFKVFDES